MKNVALLRSSEKHESGGLKRSSSAFKAKVVSSHRKLFRKAFYERVLLQLKTSAAAEEEVGEMIAK